MAVTILDVDQIEAARGNCRIGKKIVLFQSTSSTNDIAWEYASNPENDGLCVLAESQYEGRGRRGRVWFSEPGQSILCSVLLTKTDIEPELLTLTAAVATAEAVSRYCQISARIKWPNDILIQGQKVAGILVEKRIQHNAPCYVIGIGVNCNQHREVFANYNLNIPATSLAVEKGQSIDRTKFVCELLKQIEHWLRKSHDQISERWLGLSGMLGRHITVECDGRQYRGFCRGVDPVKGLVLELDNSLVRMFTAAQTSIVEF